MSFVKEQNERVLLRRKNERVLLRSKMKEYSSGAK